MRLRNQNVFVCLSLAALCLGMAVPAMAQKEITQWSDVAPDTVPGGPGAKAPPDAPTGVLTFFNDRLAFQAAAPGLPLESFSLTSVPPNSVTACPGPFNASTNNACFSPGAILPGIEVDNLQGNLNVVLTPPFIGVTCVSVGANTFVDDSVLRFTPTVNAVGVDIVCPLGACNVNIGVIGTAGSSMRPESGGCQTVQADSRRSIVYSGSGGAM